MAKISTKIAKACASAIGFALRGLPDRTLLRVKSRLGLVKQLDYPRSPIYLQIDSRAEYDVRLHSCRKEPDTVAWIEEFVRAGDVLYDVGANVGAYSLVAARHTEGKARIFAFEPAYLNFAQLCRNVHLNGCDEAIAPLSLALSDETTIETLYYSNETPGAAHHALRDSIDEQGNPFQAKFRQTVLSYRIDDLVRDLGVPAPNHLKIDVDGVELAVLRGASQTLAGPHVRSVDVELAEGEREDEITAFLEGAGFERRARHPRQTPGICNCIFTRAESGIGPEVASNLAS